MYRIIISSLLILLAASGTAAAQIGISPKRVLITATERSRELVVSNSGAVPYEISVDIIDYISRTDSLGVEFYDSVATPEEAARSNRAWVKIFPKKLILEPNSTRTFRILAAPPTDLADGEYNSRLLVTALESGVTPVGSIDTTKLTVNMKTKIRINLQVAFRKGGVNTGVLVTGAEMRQIDSSTILLVDVRGYGSAAYRGMLSGVIRKGDGSVVDSVVAPFIVDVSSQRQRLNLRNKLPHGRYDLILESKAFLPGSANELVIPATPVRQEFSVVADASGVRLIPRDF